MKFTIRSLALAATAFGAASLGAFCESPAQASSQPYIAEIMPTAATFCPRGWAEANGQLLPISAYTALFSLMGTTYGGDGRTTFALPDLRGRVIMGPGTGPGLSRYQAGQRGGSETTTLTVPNLPATTAKGATEVPVGIRTDVEAAVAKARSGEPVFALGDQRVGQIGIETEGKVQGSNLPINNVQPYTVIRYCVATAGVYPSRG